MVMSRKSYSSSASSGSMEIVVAASEVPEISFLVTLDGKRQELADICRGIGARLTESLSGHSLVTDAGLVEQANQLTVSSDDQFQEAAIVRQRLRNEQLKVEGRINGSIAAIRGALDRMYEMRKMALDPITEADKRLKRLQEAHENEKLRLKREAEEKAQAEIRRQQETARRAEAEAAAAKSRKAREEAEARAAEARREAERAKQVALAAAARPAVTKAAGASTRTERVPVVVDEEAAMAGVIEGVVPRALFVVDEKFLRECWEENRAMVIGWVGVEVQEKVVVARK